ncbi:protein DETOXIFICATION 8 [Citrus sinensis]|uniref:Protein DETOXIFICATION 8 n=1 Tax=Citrus sinensis TaxID=2711 RepID=A0ACB8K480_CITSI|nr:protein DETOXIFICATION 8 [Citrus sinensis]
MEVPLLPEREEERKLMVVVLPRLAFLEELKTLSFLSAPPAGVACFRFFLLATATMMVGHLGKLSLDSIAIANSLINVIGFIPLRLCGQAHGAEQYQKIGTYTYPAMFFCIAICQDPDFFVEACNYAIWLILTLFGYAILRSLSHNLQAQSLILALFLSSCATLCLQILLCWVLVSKTDFGNTGAELTIGISYCTRVANELGAGNPEPTRLSTCVVIFLAVAEAAIGSVALFCCRNVLAYLFNTDKDVVNYVSELVPYIGAYLNLGAFYLVGIPVASVLCFVLHLRTKGLLLGLIINARLNCRNCARHRYFFNKLGKTERILKGASSTDNRSVRCKTM